MRATPKSPTMSESWPAALGVALSLGDELGIGVTELGAALPLGDELGIGVAELGAALPLGDELGIGVAELGAAPPLADELGIGIGVAAQVLEQNSQLVSSHNGQVQYLS
jgi:hypothetical protein